MNLTSILRTTTLALAATTLLAAHSQAAELAAGDKLFVQKAAQGGMTEVQAGSLAEKSGTTAAVKDFGQMMVTDHSKANEELAALGKKEGFKVPRKLDKKHTFMLGELSKLSGAAFDKEYISAMVKGHQMTVTLFETEIKDGQDAGLKAFAEKTLPTIKMHLAKIESIQKSM